MLGRLANRRTRDRSTRVEDVVSCCAALVRRRWWWRRRRRRRRSVVVRSGTALSFFRRRHARGLDATAYLARANGRRSAADIQHWLERLRCAQRNTRYDGIVNRKGNMSTRRIDKGDPNVVVDDVRALRKLFPDVAMALHWYVWNDVKNFDLDYPRKTKLFVLMCD